MSRVSRGRSLLAAALVGGLASGVGSPARGDQALNSSERAPPGPRPPPEGKTTTTVVPIAGGSTDIGVGGGFFAGVTRDQEGYLPYRWDVQGAGVVTFLASDGLKVPYLDVYAKGTLPQLGGAPIQLEARPSFTRETTLNYYGIGNASRPPAPSSLVQTSRYTRTHPSVLLDLKLKVVDHVVAVLGFAYTLNAETIPPGSTLADDLAHGSPEVKSLLRHVGVASVAQFRYGLQIDTRDNEVTPERGTYDEVDLHVAPGGTTALPYRYVEGTVILRAYVPLVPRRAVLAARAVGDVLVGDAPFAALSTVGLDSALGGANGVRGVPAQRYYGKVKTYANAELRFRLFDFHAFGKSLSAGAVAFFDGGRLWADTSSHPELDGVGVGLKYGAGGGLRLYSGTSFVLRADVAWSPDATPIGAYVAGGETF